MPLRVLRAPCAASVLLVCAALACRLPRDPEGTLERVRGGTVRVGAIHSPPWVTVEHRDSDPYGLEIDLVRGLADAMGARVEFTVGGETALFERLGEFELDLVVGGLADDSPYADEVGLTRPYVEAGGKGHVVAGPPGENAWLRVVEAYFHAHAPEPA
jgi:polar amino acid transport system substrate-binding protein